MMLPTTATSSPNRRPLRASGGRGGASRRREPHRGCSTSRPPRRRFVGSHRHSTRHDPPRCPATLRASRESLTRYKRSRPGVASQNHAHQHGSAALHPRKIEASLCQGAILGVSRGALKRTSCRVGSDAEDDRDDARVVRTDGQSRSRLFDVQMRWSYAAS